MLQGRAKSELIRARTEESGTVRSVLHAVSECQQLGIAVQDRPEHFINRHAGERGGLTADEEHALLGVRNLHSLARRQISLAFRPFAFPG